MSVKYPSLESIVYTVLLRVYGAGICRCDHITSFQGKIEEEVMNFLEIWLSHLQEGNSVGQVEEYLKSYWTSMKMKMKVKMTIEE